MEADILKSNVLQKKQTALVPDGSVTKMPSGGGPRRKSELKIDIEGLPEGKSHADILCFDLVYFTRPAQFIILSAGVFFFYLLYGYYQELIFSLPGFTGYGWYLTLIQFGYYSIFGKVGKQS